MPKIKYLLLFLISFITIGNSQTIVTGTLLGYNGKPMIKANVILKMPLDVKVLKSVDVDKDGHFKMEVDSSGIWILHFTGVNHTEYKLALYADKPSALNVNVRLKTYDYLSNFSNVKVIGNFNEWIDSTAVPMKKNPDGTYTAEINSKSDTVIYRLVNVAKGELVEGTEAESYSYNDYQGYNSILITKPGKVKIVFDPSKLIKSSNPNEVTFSDSSSFMARFAIVYNEIVKNRLTISSAYTDYMSTGKDPRLFKYDWTKEINLLTSEIKAEKDKIILGELQLGYLELADFGARLDTAIVHQTIENIPPSSNIWSLDPNVIPASLNLAGYRGDKLIGRLKRILSENNNINVKTYVLFFLFTIERNQNNKVEASKYYNILVNQYQNTEIGKMVKERYTDLIHVKIGSPVPSFSFVSLDDSAKVITNKTLLGKNYLIDFWATWCGPCVGQMKILNDAYEKYKNKNFEILSVSFDRTAEDVVKFRNEKWKMPWFNSFISAKMQQKIQKEFDITGIPNPILVNEKGIVAAIQSELYGEKLDKTLADLLGK